MKMMKKETQGKIRVRGGKKPFDIFVQHVKGKQYNITPNPFLGQKQTSFGKVCLL